MTEQVRRIRRLALQHHKTVVRGFHTSHRHARRLLKKHRVVINKVREHSVRTAAVATISTGLLAGPALAASPQAQAAPVEKPNINLLLQDNPALTQASAGTATTYGPSIASENKQSLLRDRLNTVAPGTAANLTLDQESAVTQVVQDTFGITAKAELEGVRLNVARGIMAGEQHLPLYPGDALSSHYKNRFTGKVADPTANLTGMVPGLPSWGYFASSSSTVTKQDVNREEWYIAAQTFLAPGWQQNTNKLYNWFKYRKVIVINQQTGQAVVADIADSGPSPFTKRSFGGSNEVLIGLGLGAQRTGTVMTLFVDDPNDTIPLGPLTGYNP